MSSTSAFYASDWRPASEEQWFKRWLWISATVYFSLVVILKVLPLPEPVQEDYRTIAPRIARLLIKPQVKPKPQETAKPQEEPKEEAKKEERKPEEKKPVVKDKPKLTPEQQAKLNRQVAMKSGLLKLLSKGPDPSLDRNADKLIRDASMLTGIAAGTGHGDDLFDSLGGSGGIDELMGDLGNRLDAIRLADRDTTDVENPFELKDTDGKPVGRAYESIASVVDGLKGWIRFIYNKALREEPDLEGVVTLEFTITKDGSVTGVSVVSTTLNYTPIEEALTKRFKLLRFSASPKGGTVTVVYPITFSPLG